MRIYGSVQLCFWERSDIQQISDQAKLLAIYLLTGPHSNMLGCIRLPEGYISEDLSWQSQTVKEAFSQLEKINFLTRDDKMLWTVVHDFLKWNPIQNPRQGIGIEKLFYSVPENSKVIVPLAKSLLINGKYLNKGFTDRLLEIVQGIETVFSKPLADTEQDHDQDKDHDKDQDKDQEKDKDFLSPPFLNNYETYPQAADNEINSSQTPDQFPDHIHVQALKILEFLNDKARRVYKPNLANIQLIIDRLKSGATFMECRQVIAKKTREWKDDPVMSVYLRPKTLFAEVNFEQYVGELVSPVEVTKDESNH